MVYRQIVLFSGTCFILHQYQSMIYMYVDAAATNVALGKPVTLSSIYSSTTHGDKAVNGVKTGLWSDGCACTKEQVNPSMTVDLEATYSISSIVIYNRINCCPTRLQKVHIMISDDGVTFSEIEQHENPIGVSKTFSFDVEPSGRYLKIWLAATEYLTICEFEVFSETGASETTTDSSESGLTPTPGPIDGGWSDWSDWSICDQPCGTGYTERSRACTNPVPSNGGADCTGIQREEVSCNTRACPGDCQGYVELNYTSSGVYLVTPEGYHTGFQVYCDMDTDNGGWLVIQRREDGSVDFYRNWLAYEFGFGSVSKEHWLGNEYISDITSQGSYQLRIDMEDFDGNKRYAHYKVFELGPAATNYRLRAEGFSGDAGDSFSYHSGRPFTTKDRVLSENKHCASAYKGGWWYGSCHSSNLNGLYLAGPHVSYADGVEWNAWTGYHYSLKKTEIKMKRN